jgi:predicted enzyme related to lactoylglutathione lyase
VVVEDVAAAVAKAERLSGKVLVPATTRPDGLVFADLLDPSGNHFGVFSPALPC